MSMLALVRSLEDIPHRSIGLNNFLLFKNQHGHAKPSERLLGIWLDPDMVADTPDSLGVRNQGADQDIYIRETSGLQGIWTICWLGAADEKEGDEISRLLLLDSLIERAEARQQGPPSGRFIPVFHSNAAEFELKVEMGQLVEQNSHYVMPAWFQDAVTGRLIRPDGDQRVPELG